MDSYLYRLVLHFLSEAESQYAIIELEMLAVAWAAKHSSWAYKTFKL